ncbi:hypothetical protein DFH09DRAFT_1121235 [Mycena vulgaris]|nr:hypothetical protein DFH09DRAFT_1121235 [Mycena vulgaris]
MDQPPTSTCSSHKCSLYTTTSSSTQWGPGAMAGKAILAMGKATLRGVEHLIISRRIGTIKAVMPCTDDNGSEHLGKIFGDLLELSRPALYPDGVRIQAMEILLAQIATEQTRHLRRSIANWDIDSEELGAFLTEIVAVALFSHRGFSDPRLVDAYAAALSKDLHPWTACISFISQLAQLNEQTFQMALDVHLLEILIWVSGRQIRAKTNDTRVEAYCNVAFAILSTPPFRTQYSPWTHEMSRYFPEDPPTSLAHLIQHITEEDRWLVVERRLLEKNVHSMLRTMFNKSTLIPTFGEMYLSSQPYVPRLADAPPSLPSIRTLMWCIGIGGAAQHETINYLSPLSYERKVVVLDQMIRELVIQFIVQPSTAYSRLAKSPEFIAHVVRFLLGISDHSIPIHAAVTEAAILHILPFLAKSWEPRSIYEDIRRRVDSRAGLKSAVKYNRHTSHLLESIQYDGLVNILSHEAVAAKAKTNLVQLLQPIFSRRSDYILVEKA